jgi:hypothetical protein
MQAALLSTRHRQEVAHGSAVGKNKRESIGNSVTLFAFSFIHSFGRQKNVIARHCVNIFFDTKVNIPVVCGDNFLFPAISLAIQISLEC